MRLAIVVLLVVASNLIAAPVIPGTLKPVTVMEGVKTIHVQINDVVEVRIPNPARPKDIHDLEVKTTGDGIQAGVVHTKGQLPGSDRISIFIGLKGVARSAVVTFSYKDSDEKMFKGKVTIYVDKKKK